MTAGRSGDDTETRNMSWVKDFRFFTGETSAHGVKYIFEGPSKILKILFLLCWVAASIYSSYIIIISIVKFWEMPTSTKFEVIVDQEKGEKQVIKFPTISVCTHNKIKKSYLDLPENAAVKRYMETIDMYDSAEKNELLSEFEDPTSDLYGIKEMKYEDILVNGGPTTDRDQLLMCTQRAENCYSLPELNVTGETGEPFPVYTMEKSITGYCWRVNPDGIIKGKMGDYGTLKLMFWADVQDYGERTKDSAALGFTVAFHDNTTYGSTMSSGFLMSPGTYYKADLRLKEEIRISKADGGECDPERVNGTYGAFSEGSCILECKDKYLDDKCGCVNVVPPANNGKYTACNLEQWAKCGLDAYLAWYAEFTDPRATESSCVCGTPCSEIRYEAQVSSSSVSKSYAKGMWNNPYIRGFMENTLSIPSMDIVYNSSQDILDNLMVVDVLFTSMQKSEIREITTYAFSNLLGDIGGVLGLFLGASLFTILEFFQFLMFSINKHCCNVGGESSKEDEEDVEKKEML